LITRLLISPIFLGAVTLYVAVRGYTRSLSLVVLLAAVAFLISALQEPLIGGLQSIERMDYVALSSAIGSAGFSIFSIILVLLGVGLTGIVICAVAVSSLTLVMTLGWVRKQSLIRLQSNLARTADLIRGSLTYWLNTGIFVIYLWIDSVILSILVSSQEVGWYGVSTKLFSTLLFAPTIVGTAWYPRLVDAHETRRDQFFNLSRPYIELLMVLSVPVAFGTIVAAKPVMHALYGPKFDNAAPVMMILAICFPLTYLGTGFYQLMCASGRTRIMTVLLIVSLPVNIVSNVVFIHIFHDQNHNGALGSALSLLITEAVISLGGFLALGRHVLDRNSAWRFVRVLACGESMWLAAYEAHPLGTVASLTAGALVFLLGATLLQVLTPEERATALGAFRKARDLAVRPTGLGAVQGSASRLLLRRRAE